MNKVLKAVKEFKHIRTNTFDIPTEKLEKPLTNGHEVLEFLLQCANKERYEFKARGRGSRKKHGNVYDLPLKYAEKIAVYHNTKDRIAYAEHQEKRRSKSAGEISWLLRDIKKAIENHNKNFDNDLEILLEEKS